MPSVRIGLAVADLHDQSGSARVFGRLDQQRRRAVTRDDMRMNRIAEHGEPALQVGLPEGLAQFVLRIRTRTWSGRGGHPKSNTVARCAIHANGGSMISVNR